MALMLAGADLKAQQAPKVQEKKEIIIKEKGGAKEKMTIVIDGDNVTVNGKPLVEYDGDEVIIRKRGSASGDPFVWVQPPAPPRIAYGPTAPRAKVWRYRYPEGSAPRSSTPRAFLGVSTEDHDKGAIVREISDGSPAAKAGLKSGDIITAVAGKSIAGPEDLVKEVRSHKPGEEVDIAYLREGKKKSARIKLAERQVETFEFRGVPEFEGFGEMPGMRELELEIGPELERAQRELGRAHRELQREYDGMQREFRFDMAPLMGQGPRPKLGLRIEDQENDMGVKITQVETGSPAEKAGLKKDDLLTYIDGKKISSTDEALRILREQREKSSLPITVTRDGKPFNTEVRFPRERKEADLEP